VLRLDGQCVCRNRLQLITRLPPSSVPACGTCKRHPACTADGPTEGTASSGPNSTAPPCGPLHADELRPAKHEAVTASRVPGWAAPPSMLRGS